MFEEMSTAGWIISGWRVEDSSPDQISIWVDKIYSTPAKATE